MNPDRSGEQERSDDVRAAAISDQDYHDQGGEHPNPDQASRCGQPPNRRPPVQPKVNSDEAHEYERHAGVEATTSMYARVHARQQCPDPAHR